VVGALASGSLILLADAGHMLTGGVGIRLFLVAIWLGQRSCLTVSQGDLPGSPRRTMVGFASLHVRRPEPVLGDHLVRRAGAAARSFRYR
jgi:hypothetical protein